VRDQAGGAGEGDGEDAGQADIEGGEADQDIVLEERA